MKSYLIINHHAPATNLHTEEVLELVLSIASLGNKVSMLLLQDAALMLLAEQNYVTIERKLLQQTIDAFNLFDLEHIYIEAKILKKLLAAKLPLNNYKNLTAFAWKDLNLLYNHYDIILSF